MRRVLSIIIISVLLGMPGQALLPQSVQKEDPQKKEDPLNYKISVNVKLLPVFAVDEKGNPVFDLKKEDIELYVDKKPFEISYFKRYEFAANTIEKQKVTAEKNERAVFIILDSMFNSISGFRRSKQIAQKLVKEGRTDDRFVIFENNPITGLTHIAGPTEPKQVLLKKIKGLRTSINHWPSQLHSSRELNNNIVFSLFSETRLETDNWRSVRDMLLASERLHYRYQVERFSRLVSQFKYILKTINVPKLVFLISEGMAGGAFKTTMEMADPDALDDQRPLTQDEIRESKFQTVLTKDEKTVSEKPEVHSTYMYKKYLNNVVKAINYGGCVLYTINPRRLNDTNDTALSGENSLRYLARESGGKYFAGSDTDGITKRINQTTSAYYEVAFYTEPGFNPEFRVNVKSKRKGVRIYSTTHAQGSPSYRNMDLTQKRMFAINVLSGGNWSRSSGKVMRIPCERTKGPKKGKKNAYFVNVPLPNQMKNKKLEIFLIQRDAKTNRIDMNIVNRQAKDWVKLKIKNQKNKIQYFVIIEPMGAYCIYNKA